MSADKLAYRELAPLHFAPAPPPSALGAAAEDPAAEDATATVTGAVPTGGEADENAATVTGAAPTGGEADEDAEDKDDTADGAPRAEGDDVTADGALLRAEGDDDTADGALLRAEGDDDTADDVPRAEGDDYDTADDALRAAASWIAEVGATSRDDVAHKDGLPSSLRSNGHAMLWTAEGTGGASGRHEGGGETAAGAMAPGRVRSSSRAPAGHSAVTCSVAVLVVVTDGASSCGTSRPFCRRVLIFSGDADLLVNVLGSQSWISTLGLPVVQVRQRAGAQVSCASAVADAPIHSPLARNGERRKEVVPARKGRAARAATRRRIDRKEPFRARACASRKRGARRS